VLGSETVSDEIVQAYGAGPTTDAAAYDPGNFVSPQYPDMVTLTPEELTVRDEDGVKVLRFSNQVANPGDGNIQVRGLTDFSLNRTNALQEVLNADGSVAYREDAGVFAYHPAHNHFHVDDYTDYEIRATLDGENLAERLKVSYCLIDYDQYTAPPSSDGEYTTCGDDIQGIQAGWLDNYFYFLQGQDIDIGGLPDGAYYLVSTADPRHKFAELDDETGNCNNVAWRRFTLSGYDVTELEGGNGCGDEAAALEAEAFPDKIAEKLSASLGMESSSLAWYCDVLPGLDATKPLPGLHTVVAAAVIAVERSRSD
jgi:hypothetical protein